VRGREALKFSRVLGVRASIPHPVALWSVLMLRQSKALWISGLGVLSASFLLTTWLMGPGVPVESERPPPETPLAIFASFQVSDQRQMAAAATSARLKKSETLKGVVEELTPVGKGRTRMLGWAADKIVSGGITTILVFVDGKQIYEIQPKGPRSDVTDTLKLSATAAANVAFEGFFSCNPGRPLMFVAVEANTFYAQLAGPPTCPS
jgi:hypothetical protein